MSLLLHFSDTHFGTEEGPVTAALRALAHAQRPDVAVLSGDITQRARSAQFTAARAFCDSLEVAHLLALPGNHDNTAFGDMVGLAVLFQVVTDFRVGRDSDVLVQNGTANSCPAPDIAIVQNDRVLDECSGVNFHTAKQHRIPHGAA